MASARPSRSAGTPRRRARRRPRRDARACKETLARIAPLRGDALAFDLDITDAEAAHAVAEQVRESAGDLHVLVNNAGIAIRGRVDHPQAHANIRRVMNINYFGSFNVPRVPASLRRTRGCIINIASGAAFLPSRPRSAIRPRRRRSRSSPRP